ncbi:MAG: hypothetical protein IKT10_04180 [Clostridiales bacterium]|nr:hypothetical protein [Clostridiales bacterium]
MLKNRIVSVLLVAAMAAGITACGTDKAQNATDQETQASEVADADVKPGDATEKIYNGANIGGADTEDEMTDSDSDANSDADTAPDTDTNTPDTAAQDLVTAGATEDYVLFAYEHGNMAWGYQSAKMLILNNGDVYVFENAAGMANDQNGRDLAVTYLKKYSEPSYHISTEKLKELYDICRQIDPDVKTTDKSTGKDMGSYTFKFFDPETKREVTIIKTGDWTMTTDDKTLKKAQSKAESILGRLGAANKDIYLSLYPPVNVPYGGKDLIGKNMSFDSYDKLLEFCKKNGIDVEKYLTDNLKKSYQQAKYIVLQVYDTNRPAGGYMITDNKEFRFLPSLADYEKDPAFEGKVTVAITRCDMLEKLDLVNENGSPWK